MAKKEKTEYEIKVNELKAIIKTMKFEDVVKLRKNADGIIAGVLKAKVTARRTEINKEFGKQKKQHEKKLAELEKMENELSPTDKK